MTVYQRPKSHLCTAPGCDPVKVRHTQFHFNVAPRYTCGSPAMVDEDTARRVALQERDGHERTLTGVYGDEEVERAHRLGLNGIAEIFYETKKNWHIHDLITGEVRTREFGVSAVTDRERRRKLAAAHRELRVVLPLLRGQAPTDPPG